MRQIAAPSRGASVGVGRRERASGVGATVRSGSRWNGICDYVQRRSIMLYWALCFLVLAIVAAIFRFTGIAAASAGIAKVLFVIFLIALLISAVSGFSRRRAL